MEDEETLETSALISELPHSVEAEVHDLLANGVMTTGIVVRGILLASDELFCMRCKNVVLGGRMKGSEGEREEREDEEIEDERTYRGGTTGGRYQS